MSTLSSREVTIGDTVYRVANFKGMKAAIIATLVSRVMRERPQLQERAAEIRKAYREKNTIVITPAMAKLPRFLPLGLTTEDFASVEGKGIEFPEEPDGGTVITQLFPDMLEMALDELKRFLAILVIPNSQLEAAEDAENVDEALTSLGKTLFRQGDIDELLELLLVGLEVLQDQMSNKRERLGKLQIPFLQAFLASIFPEETTPELETPMEESPENNGPGQTTLTQTDETQSQSPNSQPPLFTDSPQGSDGVDETFSTESPGTN